LFAKDGIGLVITARNENALMDLQKEINSQYPAVPVTIISCDLSETGAAQVLYNNIQSKGIVIDYLINNAGFGKTAEFIQENNKFIVDELTVNVSTLVELTHAFLPGMVERRDGIVINIASTAAFQSLPYMAVYGATKAFVLSFTEALWGETKKTGVKVLAVCPGPTATEFFDSNGNDPALGKFIRTSENVIDSTFRALQRKNPPAAVIDGPLNKIIALTSRFSTRRFAINLSATVMKPKKKS
jgi:short-subunit dehydrogenase